MMSDAVRAVILGIVEGVTEFIPVSSTGHLLLAERFFDLGEGPFWKSFAILIQLGAILAIVALYFFKLWRIALGMFSDPYARRFVIGVLVAFLPAAVIGAAAGGYIKAFLFNPWVVCFSLIVGGAILLWVDQLDLEPHEHDAKLQGDRGVLAVASSERLEPGARLGQVPTLDGEIREAAESLGIARLQDKRPLERLARLVGAVHGHERLPPAVERVGDPRIAGGRLSKSLERLLVPPRQPVALAHEDQRLSTRVAAGDELSQLGQRVLETPLRRERHGEVPPGERVGRVFLQRQHELLDRLRWIGSLSGHRVFNPDGKRRGILGIAKRRVGDRSGTARVAQAAKPVARVAARGCGLRGWHP